MEDNGLELRKNHRLARIIDYYNSLKWSKKTHKNFPSYSRKRIATFYTVVYVFGKRSNVIFPKPLVAKIVKEVF